MNDLPNCLNIISELKQCYLCVQGVLFSQHKNSQITSNPGMI